MKKLIYAVLAAVIAITVVSLGSGAASVQAKEPKEPKILEFDTMVGVPKAFTAGANPIRGINGGGLPWVIAAAHGELKQSGKLEISVTGLVFDPNDPTVIERGLANKNTVPSFRAIVSCLAADGSTVNVMTDPFPATTGLASEGGGNATTEAQLTLPQPCVAPIVFVTNPAGAWFAVTGH
jgi:hypothetical protein